MIRGTAKHVLCRVPHPPLLLLLLAHISPMAGSGPAEDGQQMRHCSPSDLVLQYTPCDQNNKRWLYAVPRSHAFLCTAESIPAPRHGLNCSMTCPAGHFLDMHSQQCQACLPGTFSLGDRVRYEQFSGDQLPDGFSVENSPDETSSVGGQFEQQQHASTCALGGGWRVEEGELRYRWTRCVSTLSMQLHLVHAGFAEFHYRVSRESRALIQMLQVRNAQCQSYGNSPHNLLLAHARKQQQQQQESEDIGEGDIRVQRLALRQGQNLITWHVASNPVLATRMEMVRLVRLDITGLAFTPECSPCPAGTFAAHSGAQQCDSCAENEHSSKGAQRCEQCPPQQWAEPRSEFCAPRPACSSIDYFPVRPETCAESNGRRQMRVYQRRIAPPICREDDVFKPDVSLEQCPPCNAGMHRGTDGKCVQCADGEASEHGTVCIPCPAGSKAELGVFLTRWDRLPAEMSLECEFLSAGEQSPECHISPTWVVRGDRLESVQTRLRGVALEMSLHLREGFVAPLHLGRVTADNPLGHISVELGLRCKEPSCQLYVVQEFESPLMPAERELQMLALLNGTHARRVLKFPVVDPRPRRLIIAFMRSDAVQGRDNIEDVAVLYALNVTNTHNGRAHKCVHCPRVEGGKCLPCPLSEYWAESSCRRCAPGSVLNHTALWLALWSDGNSTRKAAPCSPCPPHFVGSADGDVCEFSGHFDLEDSDSSEENGVEIGVDRDQKTRMYFDVSELRKQTIGATGIRVFSRDGQSYSHVFNVSLFADRPVLCRDSLPSAGAAHIESSEEQALFCRSAAIPFGSRDDNQTGAELFVSSTIISRKLALVTRNRQYNAFLLSDDQLEYEPPSTPIRSPNRPLDVHFFFEPSSGGATQTCPNGTIGVVTLRCEPTAVANPLVRLSRRCPDGTCDGCLYHVIVESAHGCPLCRTDDFTEIRGECVDNIQRVHSIPAKHCALSGAQTRERIEPCRLVLSQNVRLLLALGLSLILFLVVVIVTIYRKNRKLECRYSRLVEGREMDQNVRTSCALGESDLDASDDEEEEGMLDSSRARVFFSARKGAGDKSSGGGAGRGKRSGGGDKYSRALRGGGGGEERKEFIAEEDESD